MKRQPPLRTEDECTYDESDPYRKLWGRVIRQAINDWRTLGYQYDARAHAELISFFFGPDGLGAIISALGLNVGVTHTIRHQVEKIASDIDLDLTAPEPGVKFCPCCKKNLPLPDFDKFTALGALSKVSAATCIECRQLYGTVTQIKKRRQTQFLELLFECRDLVRAIQALALTHKTVEHWMYRDSDFKQTLFELDLKPGDILTFSKKKPDPVIRGKSIFINDTSAERYSSSPGSLSV